MAAGEQHARAAVELAERAGDDAVRAGALASLALVRFNPGKADAPRIAEQAYELAVASGDAAQLVAASMCLAHTLLWSMQLDAARSLLERMYSEWRDRDERTVSNASWYLSMVEFRAGRWTEADEYAERARELRNLYASEEEEPTNLFPLALIAAHRGDLDRARDLARRGQQLAERQGALLAGLEGTTGLVDLWSGDAASAVEQFVAAERKAEQGNWNDPSLCWWRTEYVEALLELGRVDEALDVLGPYERVTTRLQRTWALAYATRCRGLVAATRGDVEAAAALLEEAVAQHEAAGDPFGRARTLLALGVVRRRARQKRAARDAIEAALAGFVELGAAGWTEKASGELGRISGRRRDEGLTAAERRVAALVAEGRTNREVAAALFLGERTVESHLTKVYEKLGVRSRTELASKFRGSDELEESPAP
jgi:DNA-binding CsgD family transcriptional regulator